MRDRKNTVDTRVRRTVVLAGLASIVLTGPAIGREPDIHPASYRLIYWNDWHAGIRDLEFQEARPSNIAWMTDPMVVGRHAIRVQLRRGENFTRLVNALPRAEFLLPRDIVLAPGQEYLIRWRTYLPSDFMFDQQQMEIITQIHQSGLTGAPPFMLTLLGEEYAFSVRGGVDTVHGTGGRMCCAAADQGKWVQWALQYAPDASGRQAVTHLWKDGVSVFDGSGRPNAYSGDVHAYLKFGVYKPDWLKLPSDIESVTLYFGEVSIGTKREAR
ncbi:heparin lyase I family protein [Burkholderia cenocepacia]|uniref:heparin lyase I family protein n=1 Tax=Burkholderia cenocepacia TaxID=95486 RepID=UPI002653B67A|nr:heparin lyase I family protein [Burkholderia cenocepacia]MDN7456418.1 heparin lyase I family protein [Burkholderia cenocepacia]